jgi:Integrase core domain
MEEAIGVTAACRVLGKSRAALHRHRNPKPSVTRERREFHHPAELSPEEEERVLAELDSPRFAGKSVAQAHTILLDEGCYLCSQATMHRLPRRRGTSGDRRAHASHPARKKPELLAAGPDEVWSWDITKLKGPARGTWYAQSHSRPHVSNDNPYSESAFKTLKYCPAFPGEFGSIQDANAFCEAFFTYYNTEHRHSGIAMHTPASVHDGSRAHVQARRADTLRDAFLAHPERFRGRCPQPKALPARVWINEPPATIETTPSPQTIRAA